jgi:sigma-E factor negative regulatory protein RseC
VIEETAQVVALSGNGVWVETQRRSACGECAANKGCGTATLSRVLGNKRSRIKALNPQKKEVYVGDEVVIGINEGALVRGSLAIYTVPLLVLFAFGILGQALATQFAVINPDPIVIGFSIFGLLVGFAWVRSFSKAISTDERYQAVLLRRVMPRVLFPAAK